VTLHGSSWRTLSPSSPMIAAGGRGERGLVGYRELDDGSGGDILGALWRKGHQVGWCVARRSCGKEEMWWAGKWW
jgi:hypothetical protein